MRARAEIKYPTRDQEEVKEIIKAIVSYVLENPSFMITIAKEREMLSVDIYIEKPIEKTKNAIMGLMMGLRRHGAR